MKKKGNGRKRRRKMVLTVAESHIIKLELLIAFLSYVNKERARAG